MSTQMADHTEFRASPDYKRYIERTDGLIRNTLDRLQCQPVLFVGSGLSKRYFDAPGWLDLLRQVAKRASLDKDNFNYYLQKYSGDPIALGQSLQEVVFEWAWKKGENHFPKSYFEKGIHQSCFIKFLACEVISSLTPKKSQLSKLPLFSEIQGLRSTSPHAVITTNYDNFLEKIFEGYEPIIG